MIITKLLLILWIILWMKNKLLSLAKKKGQVKWKSIGYYSSLESLFNNYFDVRLMRSNANGLSEILEVCEKIKGEITTITDGFKKF